MRRMTNTFFIFTAFLAAISVASCNETPTPADPEIPDDNDGKDTVEVVAEIQDKDIEGYFKASLSGACLETASAAQEKVAPKQRGSNMLYTKRQVLRPFYRHASSKETDSCRLNDDYHRHAFLLSSWRREPVSLRPDGQIS